MAIAANAINSKAKGRVRSNSRRRDNIYGYLFLTPWLIGFLGLFVGPGLASLYLSLTKYDVISTPEFIGIKNYVDMFTKDDLFWASLGRTFYFAGLGVPLGVLGSLYLAILLNNKLKGITIFRITSTAKRRFKSSRRSTFGTRSSSPSSCTSCTTPRIPTAARSCIIP